MTLLVGHRWRSVAEGMALLLAHRLPVGRAIVATTATEVCAAARSAHPSLAVLDVALDAGLGGRAPVCRTVAGLGVPVVMVAGADPQEHVALVEAGARALLSAGDGIDGLEAAVRAVQDGCAFVSPRLLGPLLTRLLARDADPSAARLSRLSPREREVLSLLGAGADQRGIAARLAISPHTAKTHITRVLAKLDVGSRSEAAGLAVALGLVPSAGEAS